MAEQKHVLIVDDNAGSSTFAASVLLRAGYVVTEASTSAMAVAALGTHVYSAILLDLKMPHDGISMLDYISENFPELLPRLILLAPSVNRPVWGVLSKPFQAGPLLSAVDDCSSPRT